ncbi:MAG: hypothetical protein AAGA54_17405 [Myxococcota bacterium]
MSLLKTRPTFELFAPRTMTPGESASARVVVHCSEPVPVDELTLELVCSGVWYQSTQHGQQRYKRCIVRLIGVPLKERVELPKGAHEYRVVFAVPADAPPSFSGKVLSVEWEFRVRASIPWWPDAKGTFVAHVAPRPSTSAPPQPKVYASNVEGPDGTKPYAEVSLGAAVSGQPLVGSVALSNTAYNDYRAVELRLISRERMPSGFGKQTATRKHATWRIELDSPAENEEVQFRLLLPEMAQPFETQNLSMRWTLCVRLCLSWAIDTTLWIPLEVHNGTAADRSEASAPLAVGNDRLAAVWRQAGRDSGFNYRDAQLSRECGPARLVIRREHRGRRGLQLVAEALYPDLDLGLRVKGGRLRCRDPGQSAVLAEQIDPVQPKLELEHADDQRIAGVLNDPGTRVEPVADLAKQLLALWQAFDDLRETLPAPADMADAVPAFQAAARRLGGELDVASMDIRGSRYEIPFALEVQWEGSELARTVLEVRPTLPIDGRWHQSETADDVPLPDGLAALVDENATVSIDRERVRLVFPPCGANVSPMVERLEAMLEVASRMSGRAAGYR